MQARQPRLGFLQFVAHQEAHDLDRQRGDVEVGAFLEGVIGGDGADAGDPAVEHRPHPVLQERRDVAVDGDHEGDRLADVVHLVLRQGVLRAAVGERRVRDEQRQRLGHRVGEVVVGPDGQHALDVEHVGDVDVGDPRVGVRRAQHRGVQQAWVVVEEVVDVAALAAQEALVLDARDLGAEELGGHWPSPPPSVVEVRAERASKPSSAARSTDFTMFW